MDRQEGDVIADAMLDAVGLVQERVKDPKLMAVVVTLVIEDEDGYVHVVSGSWPAKD